MLTASLAVADGLLTPEQLWMAWNTDPTLLFGLFLAALSYRRGRTAGPQRASDVWRARCFAAALVTIVVALVSPLDALSGALASAHMVQHVLLLLVAAPLLALAAPSSRLLRGNPLALQRAGGRWRRRLGLTHRNLRVLRLPAVAWLLHAGGVWFWHASVPYDAALSSGLLHVAEHATFLFTALWFWQVILGARAGASRVSPGLGILLVFGMAMQSVFLSALLTFARAPWYAGYSTTTAPWGLDRLADQQLAGVIMWVPAGFIYLGVALTLLLVWLRAAESDDADSDDDLMVARVPAPEAVGMRAVRRGDGTAGGPP